MTSQATQAPEAFWSSWDADSMHSSEDVPEPAIKWSFWSGSVVDGQLNPIHLAVGTRGYHIQSEVLHIPDSKGIFSPGPPRLQVYEGREIVVACTTVFSITIMLLILMYALYKIGKLTGLGVAIFLCSFSVMVNTMCCALRFARQRSPGYVFEDWKIEEGRTDGIVVTPDLLIPV